MKTSELIGPALDWAVAKCEGEIESVQFSALASSKHYFAPSKKWAQGGPIIEREKLSLAAPNILFAVWSAMTEFATNKQDGETALIAAMRCYIASKLGEEVDIPEELLT